MYKSIVKSLAVLLCSCVMCPRRKKDPRLDSLGCFVEIGPRIQRMIACNAHGLFHYERFNPLRESQLPIFTGPDQCLWRADHVCEGPDIRRTGDIARIYNDLCGLFDREDRKLKMTYAYHRSGVIGIEITAEFGDILLYIDGNSFRVQYIARILQQMGSSDYTDTLGDFLKYFESPLMVDLVNIGGEGVSFDASDADKQRVCRLISTQQFSLVVPNGVRFGHPPTIHVVRIDPTLQFELVTEGTASDPAVLRFTISNQPRHNGSNPTVELAINHEFSASAISFVPEGSNEVSQSVFMDLVKSLVDNDCILSINIYSPGIYLLTPCLGDKLVIKLLNFPAIDVSKMHLYTQEVLLELIAREYRLSDLNHTLSKEKLLLFLRNLFWHAKVLSSSSQERDSIWSKES